MEFEGIQSLETRKQRALEHFRKHLNPNYKRERSGLRQGDKLAFWVQKFVETKEKLEQEQALAFWDQQRAKVQAQTAKKIVETKEKLERDRELAFRNQQRAVIVAQNEQRINRMEEELLIMKEILRQRKTQTPSENRTTSDEEAAPSSQK